MLTIFTVPRPFEGHNGMIQRNALKSWTLLQPKCEVILFGDERGTAEAAKEYGFKHVPGVKCNAYGTPLLDDIFEKVEALATNDILGFISTDVILMDDLQRAVERVKAKKCRFLICGRRWEVDINEPMSFEQGWQDRLQSYVRSTGKLSDISAIDYIIFEKGFFGKIPPYAIGRSRYDNWWILFSRKNHRPTIDATDVLTIVHQSHDHSHIYKDGKEPKVNTWTGPECDVNKDLYGRNTPCYSLHDANWKLTKHGLMPMTHIESMKHTFLRALKKH
jgi:hypothetical protein